MRILEVNGVSLLGATHQEAVNALRAAGNELQIIVCKGYDKSSLIHSIGSGGGMSTGFDGSTNSRLGSRTSETGSELSHSVSSLDRDDGGIDDSLTATVNASSVSGMQIASIRMQIANWIFRHWIDATVCSVFLSKFQIAAERCVWRQEKYRTSHTTAIRKPRIWWTSCRNIARCRADKLGPSIS